MDRATVTLNSGAHKRTHRNRDTLIGRVPFMNGIKTGHTNSAGYLLVGSATRHGVTLVSSVLGTRSEGARNSDTLALMRYGFKRYTTVTAVKGGEVYAMVKVKGRDQSVELVAPANVKRVVRRGQRFTTKAVVPAELTGPLALGAKAGTLNIIYRGRVVDRTPLVTTASVAAPAVAESGSNLLVRGFVFLVIAAGTIGLVLMRRRAKRRHRRTGTDSEARIA
jgi:D-alanyl-D-alanine carboxypeptidase (penicillin-binding protein 5/6)